MTVAELLAKVGEGESDTFELRADVRDTLSIAQLIGGLANTSGGHIAIGIREPNQIVGVDAARVVALVDRVKSALEPVPTIVHDVLNVQGQDVVVIGVEKSRDLVFAAGAVYRRSGDMTMPMSAEELSSFLRPNVVNADGLTSLASLIEKQTRKIDDLGDELAKARSWKVRWRDWLMGAVLSVIIALFVSEFLGVGKGDRNDNAEGGVNTEAVGKPGVSIGN